METMPDCFAFVGVDMPWDGHLCEQAIIYLGILIQLSNQSLDLSKSCLVLEGFACAAPDQASFSSSGQLKATSLPIFSSVQPHDQSGQLIECHNLPYNSICKCTRESFYISFQVTDKAIEQYYAKNRFLLAPTRSNM